MPKNIFALILLVLILFFFNPAKIFADNPSSLPAGPPNPSSPSSLISQISEQGASVFDSALNSVGQLVNNVGNSINSSEIYQSLKLFWYQDIASSIFVWISQLFYQLLHYLCYELLPNIISYLGKAIGQFFLNNDLTQVQNSSANSNDLAWMLQQFYNTMRSIALDLSLLLFILSIWRYWVDAAWKGSNNLMSAIGRLIFATGMILAWPTIYSYQIQLSNQLMSALFLDNSGNIQFLNLAITRFFNIDTIFNLTNAVFISMIGAAGDITMIIAGAIFCFLAIIIIGQLLYLIILKAVQLGLMTAQYVFAPIFLILLANPVTDNIATGYIRTFVEVSLWNFVWLGLLKILMVVLYSNFNLWGKILAIIGILQIMLDVPQFLGRAKISVASDYVSPHFFTKSFKDIFQYDNKIKDGIATIQAALGIEPDKKRSKTSSSPELNTQSNDFNFCAPNAATPGASPPPKINTPNNASGKNEKSPPGKQDAIFTGALGTSSSYSASGSSEKQSSGSAVAIASSIATAIAIASTNNNGSQNNSPPPKTPSPDSGNPPGNNPGPGSPPKQGPQGPYPQNPAPAGPFPNSPFPKGSELNNFHPPQPGSLLDISRFTSGMTNLYPRNSATAPSPSSKSHSSPETLNPGQTAPPTKTSPFTQQQTNNSFETHTDPRPSTKPNFIIVEKENYLFDTAKSYKQPPDGPDSKQNQSENGNSHTDMPKFAQAVMNTQSYKSTGQHIKYSAFLQSADKKDARQSPYFSPYKKPCSQCNCRSVEHFNDLIFGYGNIPTLMGIPPIYPEASKT